MLVITCLFVTIPSPHALPLLEEEEGAFGTEVT